MQKDEIFYMLKESANGEALLQEADMVRRLSCGDDVQLRGIIEFSNYCCRNCLYCGLRRDNSRLNRYRMSPADIISLAKNISSLGIRTIVLQSGDDFHYTRFMLCKIIEEIKAETDMSVTLSLGERPLEDYRAYRLAGADRYLLKHETANEKFYATLHPGQSLKERLRILEYLRRTGYQIGAGNIVGLPGQQLEDLCMDILFLKELDPDMISIGLFIPQKDTPLAGKRAGDVDLTLRILAAARIVSKNSHMPVTTALVTADREGGILKGLKAGANVIMPDFTPSPYREAYSIYDNKVRIRLDRAFQTIKDAGRTVAKGRGDSLKTRSGSLTSLSRMFQCQIFFHNAKDTII
jgi:biotin synthase